MVVLAGLLEDDEGADEEEEDEDFAMRRFDDIVDVTVDVIVDVTVTVTCRWGINPLTELAMRNPVAIMEQYLRRLTLVVIMVVVVMVTMLMFAFIVVLILLFLQIGWLVLPSRPSGGTYGRHW